MTALHGLVRIAQIPQGKSRRAPATHSGVMPAIEKRQGAVLWEVVEGNALLYVRSGLGHLPEHERGSPQCVVRLKEERGVLYALGQGEELLSQLPRGLEL